MAVYIQAVVEVVSTRVVFGLVVLPPPPRIYTHTHRDRVPSAVAPTPPRFVSGRANRRQTRLTMGITNSTHLNGGKEKTDARVCATNQTRRRSAQTRSHTTVARGDTHTRVRLAHSSVCHVTRRHIRATTNSSLIDSLKPTSSRVYRRTASVRR